MNRFLLIVAITAWAGADSAHPNGPMTLAATGQDAGPGEVSVTAARLDVRDAAILSGRPPRSGPGLPLPACMNEEDVALWTRWIGWSDEEGGAMADLVRAWTVDQLAWLRPEITSLWERSAELSGKSIDFSLDPEVHRRWRELVNDSMKLWQRLSAKEAAFIRELPVVAAAPLTSEQAEELLAIRAIRRSAVPPPLIGVLKFDAFAFLAIDAGWSGDEFADERTRPTIRRYLVQAGELAERRVRQRGRLMAEFPARFYRAKAIDAGATQPIWSFWSDVSEPNARTEVALVRLTLQTLTEISALRGGDDLALSYRAKAWPGMFGIEKEVVAAIRSAISRCDDLDEDRRALVEALAGDCFARMRTLATGRLERHLDRLRTLAVTRETEGVMDDPDAAANPERQEGAEDDRWQRVPWSMAELLASQLADDCPDEGEALSALARRLRGRGTAAEAPRE